MPKVRAIRLAHKYSPRQYISTSVEKSYAFDIN
jgi:hypothetical protein